MAKAQFVLTNSLSCDVVISFEAWKFPSCTVQCSGTVTVPAGQSVNLPCAIYDEVCINVIDIGGEVPGFNHTTLSVCHTGVNTWNATLSGTGTCGTISWQTLETAGGWTIW